MDELRRLADELQIRVDTTADWPEEIPSQGVRAWALPPELRSELRSFAQQLEASKNPLFLLLDGITDPHNFGAIIRTAAAAGVDGIIVRERRQSPITDVVVKASAGTAYLVPIFVVSNLMNAIRDLRALGFWSAAAANSRDAKLFTEYDWNRKLVVVVGAEGAGVSELLLNSADDVISIPIADNVESLNVSVATGLLLFEAVRVRESGQ